MRETDDAAIRRASVFVDTETALAESGDLLQPLQSGAFVADRLAGTLSDLCAGRRPGRRAAQELTLFKAVDVFQGLKDTGYLLVNTNQSFGDLHLDAVVARLPAGHAVTVPATELALKHIGRPVPNAALLGAGSGGLALSQTSFKPWCAARQTMAATQALREAMDCQARIARGARRHPTACRAGERRGVAAPIDEDEHLTALAEMPFDRLHDGRKPCSAGDQQSRSREF